MEHGVLVERNNQEAVSAIASMADRSHIKIEAISINLNSSEKNEIGECEHFSIRGFTAMMRQKDGKTCWPFKADGENEKAEEIVSMLPPLHVPNSRWWKCQNCLRKTDVKGTTEDVRMVSDYCLNELKSTNCCSAMSIHDDEALLPSNCEQASKLVSFGGGNVHAIISTNANIDENGILPDNEKNEKDGKIAQTTSDNNEKKVEVEQTINFSRENSSTNDVNLKTRATSSATKSDPRLVLEQDDTTSLKLNCPEDESFKPDSRSKGVADNDLSIQYPTFQVPQNNSADDQHKELVKPSEASSTAGATNGSVIAETDKMDGHPSTKVDGNYESSDNDDIVVRGFHKDQNHTNSGAHCRKFRKVRLLTDLLNDSRNTRASVCANKSAMHLRTEDLPSKESTGAGSHSISQHQAAIQENTLRSYKDQNKKRKMLHDRDWKSSDLINPNKVNKKVGMFKGNSEATTVSKARSRSNSSVCGVSSIDGDSKCFGNRNDRHHIIQKKMTKTRDLSSSLFSFPPRETDPNQPQIKLRKPDTSQAADTVTAYQAVTERMMDPPPNCLLPSQQTEKDSNLFRKKDKMPKVGSMQGCQMLCDRSMLGESSITRQDVVAMQNGPEIRPFQSVQDEFSRKGLYLSLDNYLASKRNDSDCNSHIEDHSNSLMPKGNGLSRDQFSRKDASIMYVGETSVPSYSSTDSNIWKGVSCHPDFTRTTNGIPLLNELNNHNPLVEDGHFSFMHKADFSCEINNEKIVGIRERPPNQNCPRDDKVFKEGASDDIPMEIVELMAKNQLERRLHDTEKNHHMLETTSSRSAVILDATRGYMFGESGSAQDRLPLMSKSRPGNARINMFTTSETPTKAIDYFSYWRPSEGVPGSHPLHQPKHSTAVQFAVATGSGSGRHNDFQKFNCVEDRISLGDRSSPSLHAFKAYKASQTAPQQSEKATGFWSSVTENHLPFGIKTPQNCATQPFNLDMLSKCPNHLRKGIIGESLDLKGLNSNVANVDKRNKNFKAREENPYAFHHRNGISIQPQTIKSSDVYSNETISAMHLLSLMDAGMQASTPTNGDVSTKFLKRSSFSHDQKAKESRELDFGLRKTSRKSKQPSSDNYRKNHPSQMSCQCPPAPKVGDIASTLQSDTNIRRATVFSGQSTFTSDQKWQGKTPYLSLGNEDHNLRKPVFTSVGFGKNCNPFPVKIFHGVSHLKAFSSQGHTIGESTKLSESVPHSTYRTLERSSETEICSFNRNPADFSMPGPRNVYMIAAKDLKFGKEKCADKFQSIGQKRQKNMKLVAVKQRDGIKFCEPPIASKTLQFVI